MKKAIIDSSVMIRSMLRLDQHLEAYRILTEYDPVLIDLVQIECANTLCRYVRSGKLEHAFSLKAITTLQNDFKALDSKSLIPDAMALSVEYNHSVYDCLFVTASRSMKIPLATADKKLANKFSDTRHPAILNLYNLPETLP